MFDQFKSIDTNSVHKTKVKQTYSNNYLSDHHQFSSESKKYNSMYSLPSLVKEKMSFTQFIAKEKYNLQFFHSFKQKQGITDKEKVIRKRHTLSHTKSRNDYTPTITRKQFHKEKSSKYITHDSSDFAISESLESSSTKKTKHMSNLLTHKTIDIITTNKLTQMYCVERHMSYMNDKQTKSALCFILQFKYLYPSKNVIFTKRS